MYMYEYLLNSVQESIKKEKKAKCRKKRKNVFVVFR